MTAGRQHAQRGAAEPASHVTEHGNADRIEHAHDRQRRRQLGVETLQLKPDGLVALGVQGEQLRARRGRRLAVEAAGREHDAPLQQPLKHLARPVTAVDPATRRRYNRIGGRSGGPRRRTGPEWLTGRSRPTRLTGHPGLAG